MEELHAALVAAIRALRAAEAQAQALTRTAAAAGVRVTDDATVGTLQELRQAAGDVHRAVAVLIAGPAGHGG